jgi:hypothetical protein
MSTTIAPLDDFYAELLRAACLSQAVGVAAELGVADVLSDGPHTVQHIATTVGCDASALLRLLHALAAAGLCELDDEGRCSLTSLGARLRSGHADGVRGTARWWSGYRWKVWGELRHAVVTGNSQRVQALGRAGFDQFDDDALAAEAFNGAMSELGATLAGQLCERVDFATCRTLIDVGGGYGILLSRLLARYPALHGVLFDLPHALRGAAARLAQPFAPGRCDLVAGDFFTALPHGGDVYVLQRILHDWPDDECVRILRNCRAVMAPYAKLIVVERVVPARIGVTALDVDLAVSDLNMLVMLGGRERTLAQFRTLFEAAALRLHCTTDLALGFVALTLEARA